MPEVRLLKKNSGDAASLTNQIGQKGLDTTLEVCSRPFLTRYDL